MNAAASASGKPRSSTPPLSAIFASMRSCTCVSKFPGVREIEKARTRGHAILAATEEHALNKRSHLPDWQRPISWPPRDSCSLPATGARRGNGGHQIRAEKAARAGSRWQPLQLSIVKDEGPAGSECYGLNQGKIKCNRVTVGECRDTLQQARKQFKGTEKHDCDNKLCKPGSAT